MEKFFPLLLKNPLFAGIAPDELGALLGCLGARTAAFSKGQWLFREGDAPRGVGLLLEGSVQIQRLEYDGARNILAHIAPGELFGEIFACAGLARLPVSAQGMQEGRALMMDFSHLITPCGQACAFHRQLIANLLKILAEKNLMLNQKIRCMGQPTTQKKLMAYLTDQARRQGKREFRIPFDRQALADYLGVERSAMSAQIGLLKKQGLIESRGSWFRLLAPPDGE